MATVALPAAKWSWEPPYAQVRTSNSLDADVQLVERCLGGQEAAWEDLVKVHTRRVYSICYRFTNSDSANALLSYRYREPYKFPE